MKLLVISDLHSNEDAVRAVFQRVRRRRFDRIVCLGDVVGYGAEPNQVLDRLRRLPAPVDFVRGNHDRVVNGDDDGSAFNEVARVAAFWTRDKLSRVNRHFLSRFRVGPFTVHEDVTLCHGSPADEDQYLVTLPDADEMLRREGATWISLFGHTHLPTVFELRPDGEVTGCIYRNETSVRLDRKSRYLINPGSVGQPRDRNPDASFAIVDTGKGRVQFLRVPYDRPKTQRAILAAGLPKVLAQRLDHGA